MFGLFGSETIITVQANTVQLVEKNKIPNTVTNSTVESIIDRRDIPLNILDDLVLGSNGKAQNYYRYGRSFYHYGLSFILKQSLANSRMSTMPLFSGSSSLIISSTIPSSICSPNLVIAHLSSGVRSFPSLSLSNNFNASTNSSIVSVSLSF